MGASAPVFLFVIIAVMVFGTIFAIATAIEILRFLAIATVVIAVAALHLLFALALTRAAKAHGIRKVGSAWLPVLNLRLLGRIVDTAREEIGKKPLNLCRWLTIVGIVMVGVPVGAMLLVLALNIIYQALHWLTVIPRLLIGMIPILGTLASLVFALPFQALISVMEVVKTVGFLASALAFMAIFVLYLVFAGALVHKRVLFTVLSVIFPPLSPILLLILAARPAVSALDAPVAEDETVDTDERLAAAVAEAVEATVVSDDL